MKNTPNYPNKIINRSIKGLPLTWDEMDGNDLYGNIWKIGFEYKISMVVLWNDYIGNNNTDGRMSFWMCRMNHVSDDIKEPGTAGGNTYWDRIDSDESLSIALEDEISSRVFADEMLSTAISSEMTSRISIDFSLSVSLGGEMSNRMSTDYILTNAISKETVSRISTDLLIQNKIDNQYGSFFVPNTGVPTNIIPGGLLPNTKSVRFFIEARNDNGYKIRDIIMTNFNSTLSYETQVDYGFNLYSLSFSYDIDGNILLNVSTLENNVYFYYKKEILS